VGRPRGAKNKRTILREADEEVDRAKATNEVPLDCIFVIEMAIRHFFLRAAMGKNAGHKAEEIGEDYKQAAALAAMVAPYRHARLSAVKVAGDPNNPARFKDDANLEELKAEVMKHLTILAPVLGLEALITPAKGTANGDVSQDETGSIGLAQTSR
jgi:hypothetical protein